MATDRQKICKCGADVAEFLSDIDTDNMFMETLYEIVKDEYSRKGNR